MTKGRILILFVLSLFLFKASFAYEGTGYVDFSSNRAFSIWLNDPYGFFGASDPTVSSKYYTGQYVDGRWGSPPTVQSALAQLGASMAAVYAGGLGGGSQTPWTSNINGAGYNLTNVGIASASIVNIAGASALTVAPRMGTVSSSANPLVNIDTTDMFTIASQAVVVTSFTTNLTGNPRIGQKLIIRILDNGTARAITWGARFRSVSPLPTTTIAGKYVYVGFIYNEITSTWDCVAVAQE